MSNQENHEQEGLELPSEPVDDAQAQAISAVIENQLQTLLAEQMPTLIPTMATAAPMQRVEQSVAAVLGQDGTTQLKGLVADAVKNAVLNKVKEIGKPALITLVSGLLAAGAGHLIKEKVKTNQAIKAAELKFESKTEIVKQNFFLPNRVWIWNSPESSFPFGTNKITLAPGETFITRDFNPRNGKVVCARQGAQDETFELDKSFFDTLAQQGYMRLIVMGVKRAAPPVSNA